jgi:hypothetical protein
MGFIFTKLFSHEYVFLQIQKKIEVIVVNKVV